MTKCSHDSCENNAITGSSYCNNCIQLPAKICNFCNTEQLEFSYSTDYDYNKYRWIDLLAELIVCLPLSLLILALFMVGYMALQWAFNLQQLTNPTLAILWLVIYALLLCWVRIGSMNIKWSSD
jgi:small-conductance mechanosensitive channel